MISLEIVYNAYTEVKALAICAALSIYNVFLCVDVHDRSNNN